MEKSNYLNYKQRKELLIERDNGICKLCLFPIDDLTEFTEDHILPKSKGGSNELDNLQSAHYKCNWLKGNYPEYFTTEDYQNYYLGKTSIVKHYKSGMQFTSLTSLKSYIDSTVKKTQNKVNVPRVNRKADDKVVVYNEHYKQNVLVSTKGKQVGTVLALGTHEIIEGKLVPKKITQNTRVVNPNFTKAELIANGKISAAPRLEIPESDKNLSKEAQLWNEIRRNGTKRLSYEIFRSFF